MPVTEAEWLACADPTPMLEFLRGKASDRKLRLFICACCRHAWQLLYAEAQEAVEMVERCADGQADLDDVRRHLREQDPDGPLDEDWTDEDWDQLELEGDWRPEVLALPDPGRSARMTAGEMRRSKEGNALSEACRRRLRVQGREMRVWQAEWDEVDECGHAAAESEAIWQAAALRDLFGNPLRSSSSPARAVLAWNDGLVPRLAQVVYDGRLMPEGMLDTARLAILADALLDAGCDDEALIQHCRSAGPHVRGCWAVDAVLGRS
jgi:hypothetical protein